MLETMPNKTGGDNPSCRFVTWMRESMNDLEYVLCPIPQNNGCTCPFQWKNITKNSEISIRDIHKTEASGRSLVADDFSRICLILSKLMKINSRESICGETRQGNCNNMAFSFDMMHVCGEFSKGKG